MDILLVDDHTLFREGIKRLLANLDPSIRITEASRCAQAVALAAQSAPNLILLDLKMPGYVDIDALGVIRREIASVPVVVLSGEDRPATIRAAIEAGAVGFIPKTASPEILVYALKIVLANGVYFPAQVLYDDAAAANTAAYAASQAERMRPLQFLSERQLVVLKLVIQGQPNKVIARHLAIAEGTVKAHVSALLRA